MTITSRNFGKAKVLHNRLQMRLNSLSERKDMTPDHPEYKSAVEEFNRFDNTLREYTASQRKVDDGGKLTEDAPTASPSSVGDPRKANYFFEPNVREVQEFLRSNPQAMDRLGLRSWADQVSVPEQRQPLLEPNTGAVTGYHITPPRTNLDQLSEDQEPYTTAADEMWNARMAEAQRKGESVKRYRDVKWNGDEWGDVVVGGVTKGMQRVVAPALMGAADAATLGMAAPLGDAITDLADYELGKRGINLEDYAGEQPRSREVMNRNMPAYVAGNLAGYGLPRNPTNLIQSGVAEVAAQKGPGALRAMRAPLETISNYSQASTGRRLGAAAAGAAAGSAVEGAGRDMASEVQNVTADGSFRDLGNAAARTAANVPVNTILGGLLGTSFDAAAQGIGELREGFSGFERNAPLRTLEQGGGKAGVLRGAIPPTEVAEAFDQARRNRMDPTKAPTTAAGDMSARLAPELDESIRQRSHAEYKRQGQQMEDYYAHPDYRHIEESVKPAMQALADMASKVFGRSSVDGSPVPVDLPKLKRIGNIFNEFAEPTPIPYKDAPALAAESNGIVIDGETANHIFGDTMEPLRPGQVMLLRPINVNAQALTRLEDRIYEELNFNPRGNNQDPVWTAVNEGVKESRDKFPWYEDEAGNLVGIPPESSRPEPFPLDPGAVPQQGEMHIGAPPIDVRGGPPQKPPGMMDIGQGNPPIPENPFDARLPVARESIQPLMTVDVRGDVAEPGYIGPEAIPGVGPNYQPPDDPRRLGPPVEVQGQFDMGGEYAEPPAVAQPDMLGVGPQRRFNQPMEPQQTQSVQGTYNLPPEVQMEPAPATNRNPYGFANRGQPEPEVPLPPSERNPLATSAVSEESLAALAGKEPPMSPAAEPSPPAEVEPIRGETMEQYVARGGKVGYELQPDIQAKVDDGTLTNEDQQKAATRYIQQRYPDKSSQASANEPPPARTEAPAGKTFAILDKQDGAVREKTFATAAEAKKEAARLNAKYKSQGRFKVKGADAPAAKAPDKRGPLEKMFDAKLDATDAPPVPKTEIEEIGALQTADREKVAKARKAYVEDIFSPDREARATEMAKVSALGEHPEVIEEAIEQIKKIDERLGPLTMEQRKEMIVSAIKAKTGVDVKAEDLVRFGLISAGLVQMAEGDDESGAAMAGIGAFFGRGKKGPAPAGPQKPKKPTQPTAKLPDGRVVKGLSAVRNRQHTEQELLEKAMKRLGVEGDTTLEGRIRTYGQLDDRGKVDQALLDEANAIGKGDNLRQAAAANAYQELKDRSTPFGSLKGLGNAVIDFLGFRLYAGAEYPAGRFTREQPRNPYVREPTTLLGDMQKELLEDPTRRLLDLSAGAPGARWTNDFRRLYGGDEYETDEKGQRKPRRAASP